MSCLLCNLSLDLEEFDTATIKWRGIQTILQCSIDRNDTVVADSLRNVDSVTMHEVCRRNYIKRKNGKLIDFHAPKPSESDCSTDVKFEYIPIYIKKTEGQSIPNVAKYPNTSNSDCAENLSAKNATEIKYLPDGENILSNEAKDKGILSESYLESQPDCEQISSNEADPTKPFPFQHNCLFCGKEIDEKAEFKKAISRRNHIHTITRDQSQETILRALKKNPTPTNMKIIRCIQDVDLVRVKARYHNKCYLSVITLRDVPTDGKKRKLGKNVQLGRPECPLILAAVDKICRYIDESDRTEFTATELKAAVTSDDYQPCWRTIETKLSKRYEGKIYFTPWSGRRSTVVTVVKAPRPGGSAVIQPWNMNSTELGGLTEEVEVLKNKRKYYMTNKELSHKETRKQIKKKNNVKIKENKSVKETTSKKSITEDNDDDNDNIDDTFDSEQHVAEAKSKVLCCQICLSSDRRLEDLGIYSDIFRQIGSNIFINHFEPKLFLICWECIALLKNVKRFQKKIFKAQKLWNTEVQEPPKSLSTLSITTPSTASVSYTDKKQKGNLEPEIVTVDIFPQEDTQLTEDQKPVVEEINVNYDTFDNAKKISTDVEDIDDDTFNDDSKVMDDSVNDDSEYEERTRPKLKRRKAQAKRIKRTNSDQESDPPKTTTQQKIRKTSSEDPDWNVTTIEKNKPQKEKKNKHKLKIPYTMIVQTYITETKMKREAIAPHELQYWLDTEINSDYFKNLEHKCVKCISEVPENHYELCHSNENPYVCDICECTFLRNDDKQSHLADHYYVFSCEFCGYKCYNLSHMRGHVESHRRMVQCLECFAAFQTFDLLKEHFNNLHRYAECDYCGKQFAHKRTVVTHIERCHTPQTCTICNTSYSSYSHKMHHMNLKHRIERTESAYCVQCDIQFDNVAQLKRHVYHNVRHKHEWKREPPMRSFFMHHMNLRHRIECTESAYCVQCDIQFDNVAQLKRHVYHNVRHKHEWKREP
ncbi:hypothetical protein O0L34_g10757 [Tuta absoluta]|nr:hypothetical protein O0L34_g10757 [Tuta absoluta]